MEFSRPDGTHAGADDDPAMNRRAIAGLSRWDERGTDMSRRIKAKTGEFGISNGLSMNRTSTRWFWWVRGRVRALFRRDTSRRGKRRHVAALQDAVAAMG